MDTATQTPLAPLRRAFNALINVGRDLHARLTAAIAAKDTAYLPRHLRANPASAEIRIARTLDWIVALARTLAGDTLFLPPYRIPVLRHAANYPALTNAIRATCGLPLNPPTTPAQRTASRLRYMRRVFATQPVGVIAARLARRLAIIKGADAWPNELIAIPQTPAIWAKNHAPAPTRPVTPSPPPDITPIPATPPAYHPRE